MKKVYNFADDSDQLLKTFPTLDLQWSHTFPTDSPVAFAALKMELCIKGNAVNLYYSPTQPQKEAMKKISLTWENKTRSNQGMVNMRSLEIHIQTSSDWSWLIKR